MNKWLSPLQKIHIHPLMWVVVFFAVITAHFIELTMLLLIIFIHEMGHAVAASFFSWRVKKVSLLPFGGVAEMDEHGNRRLMEEAIVTLAGPVQHVWLIGLAFLLLKLNILHSFIYELFISFNLMVLLFNLLPIWPLDGGKLVFLLFSLKNSFPKAHMGTLMVSLISLIVFCGAVLLIAPLHLNMWIVAIFLWISLYTEWKQQSYVFIRFLLERYYGKKNTFRSLKPIFVSKEDYIIDVLKQFQRGNKHIIIVEQNGKEQVQLDENELLHAYFAEKQLTAKISDLLFQY